MVIGCIISRSFYSVIVKKITKKRDLETSNQINENQNRNLQEKLSKIGLVEKF